MDGRKVMKVEGGQQYPLYYPISSAIHKLSNKLIICRSEEVKMSGIRRCGTEVRVSTFKEVKV